MDGNYYFILFLYVLFYRFRQKVKDIFSPKDGWEWNVCGRRNKNEEKNNISSNCVLFLDTKQIYLENIREAMLLEIST